MTDFDAARAKLRRKQLRRMLYTVYPGTLGAGILAENIDADLQCSPEQLARDLDQLQRKRYITHEGAAARRGVPIFRLSADGIDRTEAEDDFDRMSATAQRMLRLRVLQALDWGRPQPIGLRLIAVQLAEDTDLDLSEPSLGRALAYLGERGLAAPVNGAWSITGAGIDYLLGEGDRQPGIANAYAW